ncbi:MAG: glycosyltransferase [bacterium]|nr:glycosyltransferase [bacterium]
MGELYRKAGIIKHLLQQPLQRRNCSDAQRIRRKYAEYLEKTKIQPTVILYEAYHGRGMLGNPYALFQAFFRRPDFYDYVHIWVVENLEESEYFISAYEPYKNVVFVERESEEYIKALACSKYLINNVTFPTYFVKREGQVYLNTWHGIPIKNLGYDIPNGEYDVGNIMMNFLKADYLLSSNSYMTQVYKESYKLNGLYPNKVLEEGMPRNDCYEQEDPDKVRTKLRAMGVEIEDDKELILFAPTYRGEYRCAQNRSEEYVQFYSYLMEQINSKRYQLLIKPHHAEFRVLQGEKLLRGKIVPDSMDANQLLTITSILITDISSIFFDFLLSKRPILFYIPDLESYKNDRGICFDLESLPGPVTTKQSDVVKWIGEIGAIHSEYLPKIWDAIRKYCPYEDGRASERIWQVILEQKKDEVRVESLDTGKKKILFYIGTLRTNGVTVSLMSLVTLLDLNKYDITIYFCPDKDKRSVFDTSHFPPGIRLLPRVGTYAATTKEEFYHGMIDEFGLTKSICVSHYPKRLYHREFSRCFGDAKFDYGIDFSGYGSFIPRVLLEAPYAKKIIWQHNNLVMDRMRVVNGIRPFETELKVVFSFYPKFDRIVGCSRNVMEINREALATKETYDKFAFVENSVYAKRVEEGIKNSLLISRRGKTYMALKKEDGYGIIKADKLIEVPDHEYINFCTIGRMSEEKNQMNLLKAFVKMVQKNSKCRLYMIGDGPLREQLKRFVKNQGIQEAVIFTGNIENPFSLLKRCDCFLLISKWEGQALAVLEARVMKLPIIISDHPGYEAVCTPGGQWVTKTSSDSIYEGMQAFIDGKIGTYDWQYKQYNEQVVYQFEQVLTALNEQ